MERNTYKMTEMELKQAICDVGHKLWQLGMVAANDGNISVRLPDGNFLVTPTGTSKASLTPEMIIKMNANNEVNTSFLFMRIIVLCCFFCLLAFKSVQR